MAELKYRTSCDACLNSKVKCSQAKPSCTRCHQQGQDCVYSPYRKIGRPSIKSAGTLASKSEQEQQQQRRQQYRDSKSKKTQRPRYLSQSNEASSAPCAPCVQPDETNTNTAMDYSPHFSTVLGLSSMDETSSIDATSMSTNMEYPYDFDFTASFDNFDSMEGGPANFGPCLNMPMKTSHSLEGTPTSLPHNVKCLDDYQGVVSYGELAAHFPGSSPSSQRLEPNLTRPMSSTSSDSESKASSSSPFHLPTHHYYTGHEKSFMHFSNKDSFCQDELSLTSALTIPEFQHWPIGGDPNNITFSRSCKSNAPASFHSSSRCMLQCQSSLTNQLAYINECQRNNYNLALGILFNLDNQICMERTKILSCPFCMDQSHREQTLVLVAVVISRLLSLFERECAIDATRNINSRSCSESSSRRSSNFPTRTPSFDSSGSITPSYRASSSLAVGVTRVDDGAVMMTFKRYLLRMYLERQMRVVGQLDQTLADIEEKGANHKIAVDFLENISRRNAHFLLVIILNDED